MYDEFGHRVYGETQTAPAQRGDTTTITPAHRSPPIITKEFIDGLRNALSTRE